ncbi:hypothetical protein [Hymenobacter algoricola]|uniref:hypothetical protein n=1 Tax=Hymenobacter algoricola TaxID=486267 RepID=UPI0031E9D427
MHSDPTTKPAAARSAEGAKTAKAAPRSSSTDVELAVIKQLDAFRGTPPKAES